jgi:hypothetical protein
MEGLLKKGTVIMDLYAIHICKHKNVYMLMEMIQYRVKYHESFFSVSLASVEGFLFWFWFFDY